jgi:hypothetical protein
METKIYKALAAFQKECPNIPLSKSGYGYKYAPLNLILSTVKPVLERNGLVLFQKHDDICIETILAHTETGETLKSRSPLPDLEYVEKTRKDKYQNIITYSVIKGFEDINANEAQALGAVITYLRRYDICCLLGIVGDEDTDASSKGSKENPPPKKDNTPPPPPPRIDLKGEYWLDIVKKYQESINPEKNPTKTIEYVGKGYNITPQDAVLMYLDLTPNE